ncbi:DUF2497 domain-containing protein [Bartonella sp. W8125]|uniref:DUF2497 domain-containing protein n=1 Tax=Bartonella TaxID=773 RepID=UPI0018DD5660|nr:DUF2497 domain-containing protein [Bartonella choladocola]MBI0140888.1 DUF2497 domain-containing protein [Bartonella choladocola]
MAQSSNALKEPNTDEILASIREIIEENTGRVNPRSNEINEAVNSVGARDTSRVKAARTAATAETASPDETAAPADKDISENNPEALTVDDAMKALAARIGLGGQEDHGSANQNPENEGYDAGTADQRVQAATSDETSQQQDSEPLNGEQQPKMADSAEAVESRNHYQNTEKADLSARQDVDNSDGRNSENEIDNEMRYPELEFNPKLWDAVESLAEQVLRPVLLKWLQNHWSSLVERILQEEIIKAFEKKFPSDRD